jgi:hypothetical protein
MSQVHINFPAIQEIAAKGVRRTAVFMGLGLNAIADPGFKQYELTHITSIQIVPPDADENTLSHYKEQFSLWIVTCGLRELMETFALFLDEVNQACLWILATTGMITTNDVSSQHKKFRWEGIKGKLDLLKKKFNVAAGNTEALITIHQARNCLTHRHGIVGPEDCYGTQDMIIKWSGIDLYGETPSGEKIPIPLEPLPDGGIVFPEGAQVKLGYSDRTKSFPLQTLVTFTPKELAEICHFILISTGQLISSAEAYAKKNGVMMVAAADKVS